ncbi:hypothetical protein OG885_25170 [Streptomyces sp. NBC_00028]|uniref:hypothetical protein n=1 Tax=Streptomyces sp. NBC_00028 TaxID=2975624 RepID=UPI003252F2C6
MTLVHSAIYATAHLGRPEGRQARGVRAGLVALLLLDQVVIWSLLTTGSAHSGVAYRAGCVLVALLPLLAVVLARVGARRLGTGAALARGTALFFGIVALLPQILAGALLVTFT